MSEEKQKHEAVEHLAALIADIPVAMLTTCGPDGSLQSRPMVNVNTNFHGDLWFFTHLDDPKVEQIRANPQLNAVFASPEQQRYVSVSGTGTVVKDKKRCELLWTDECGRWFPEGLEDQGLALVKLDVSVAEFWDAKKNTMIPIAGLFHSLGGSGRGERFDHDKVDWEPAEELPRR